MIFATVGTQLPFDRLLFALDEWAGRNCDMFVYAQIGISKSVFPNLNCTPFLTSDVMRQNMESATCIVGHAGMGTILTAAELGKPLVIMPRKASFGEHRNDHQLATATEMRHMPHVMVAEDGQELRRALDQIIHSAGKDTLDLVQPYASPQLITAVRKFVEGAS